MNFLGKNVGLYYQSMLSKLCNVKNSKIKQSRFFNLTVKFSSRNLILVYDDYFKCKK